MYVELLSIGWALMMINEFNSDFPDVRASEFIKKKREKNYFVTPIVIWKAYLTVYFISF